VEVALETARGIADLVQGTWPPNPAAIVAAALHFEAAAQYALVAGGGGGGGSSGGRTAGESGANTGGNQSSYTGGPSGGARGGGGGGSGHGPTIIWHQYDPTGNMADFARTLAGVQNQLVGSGQIKVVATNALTNGPKQT
jgi:hypothetical protein